MRAIGYFRYRDDLASPEDYETSFREYCELNLHQPVETFSDNQATGDKAYPGYLRMLDYMRAPGSEFLVVAPDASHLGHDVESVVRTVVELEGTGAKVTCADEMLPDPLQNAFQRLGIRGVSLTHSDRVSMSMRSRALLGQGLGRPPYGYRNSEHGTLEVVPEEAAVVELTYRLYTEQGLGLRLVVRHLNEREIPTRRGGKWNMVTIRDLLRNPTYMGTYTRFGMRRLKSHEAIIPPKTFRATQDATRLRRPFRRAVKAEPFLLSGLAYCDYCGNKMMGVTRRQTWRRKDGNRASGVYRYYQCQSRNNLGLCRYHTWRASVLEGTVLTQLTGILQSGASSEEDRDGVISARVLVRKTARESRVKNAQRRFIQAAKRAAKGELGVAALGNYLDELDKARMEASRPAGPTGVAETLGNWDSLDIFARRSFLMDRVERIVVKDETVEVTAQR